MLKFLKTNKLYIVITVLGIIAVFMAGRYALNWLAADLCGNEIVRELTSPNNEKVAYIFTRNCGATTGVSFQLSILDSGDKLPNASGNTFVSDKGFDIQWLSDKELRVGYDKSSESNKMRKSINRTKIEYVDQQTFTSKP